MVRKPFSATLICRNCNYSQTRLEKGCMALVAGNCILYVYNHHLPIPFVFVLDVMKWKYNPKRRQLHVCVLLFDLAIASTQTSTIYCSLHYGKACICTYIYLFILNTANLQYAWSIYIQIQAVCNNLIYMQ